MTQQKKAVTKDKCAICFHDDYHICLYIQIYIFHLLFILSLSPKTQNNKVVFFHFMLFGWKLEEGYKNLTTRLPHQNTKLINILTEVN